MKAFTILWKTSNREVKGHRRQAEVRGRMAGMETTTTIRSPIDQTELATAPPADRIRIVSTPGVRGGKPRIDGHRITVADVAVWHERQGMSPDEIIDNHPSITLSDVYAALAYYFENRDRIDADILGGESLADRLCAGQPSIIEKIRRRTSGDAKDDTFSPG
jgi:uncharacterized protein (DUF433 family)